MTATVRIFPGMPVRAWVMIEVDEGVICGVFRGERDPADPRPVLTEEGSLAEVTALMLHPLVRQGLPIVPHETPHWLQATG
ncbi:hypothetical protein [Novosphingobium sp. CECT 9465]|uniref:hypothetical protein n=1 Tax=Novosphingobium sp. CECT 9465 TaxID=2829794 RepID=UPI001E571426|nr:hypothetical protein [Novosphingobium sp. CECT 9465]CAH0496617.1 hypothetical protein NVSP9465_01654 [Novosphingobium sp. CECT 9465]